MHNLNKGATAAAMLALSLLPAHAGDAVKGAKIYKKCVSCHMIGDGAKNRIGPHLNGVIGREIGGITDYKYSKAMVKYAATEKVWSEENLAAYLESPRKVVKGGRMSFAGLRKQKDRADVIAYLKENAN
ncbi:MAG TPA: cytochrome c family protein [Rhodobiaceae bacterium]|nr:cytochrome c family protein [Rhodobiaceae bacterium]|tara:strand:- start:579 stop:965 length:387 start_codon:yes stop_codon:yes gene_type:complete